MLILCLAGAAYYVVALVAMARFGMRRIEPAKNRPGITIFKPVHGLECEIEENLRSFCEQSYSRVQVLFGVQRADDPAIPAIERVIASFPGLDTQLIVDTRTRPGNPKISNVAAMLPYARYDLFVIADADMRVDSRYADAIAAAFDDERVGAATCLYAGVPRGGIASMLAALHIDDWFAPSALLATLGGELSFCFGSTMAVRRAVLGRIGGIDALARHLADDHALGRMTRSAGYRVALSRYVVKNIVSEPGLPSLFLHELRWARTIRMVQSAGYAGSFLTYPLPFALAWLAFSGGSKAAWIACALVGALRLSVHYAARSILGVRDAIPLWLLPVRDVFGFVIWACGLRGTTVRWQEQSIVTERGLF